MDAVNTRQVRLVNVAGTGAPVLEFQRSLAVVIGINDYEQGIPPLRTARADAERLAQILADHHGYETLLYTDNVTSTRLTALLQHELPQRVGKADRLLFYFAGHGIALDGDDGPAGYLIPQDAAANLPATFLPMQLVHDALTALACRHCLVILDCCFSGAFRWSSTRNVVSLPSTLYRERYERFLRSPAWQVLTSAAYDQAALDLLVGHDFGNRGTLSGSAATTRHSPFAQALFAALTEPQSDANHDGVVSATELYLYLRDNVELRAKSVARHWQTPGLWPLKKHDKGEYIFLLGEPNLPPAPPLTAENNPYRGLASYDAADAELFFGRQALIQTLATLVEANPLTVVLGASGTGKSSVVKAGVMPYLLGAAHQEQAQPPSTVPWRALAPLRPTEAPLQALAELVAAELADNTELSRHLSIASAVERAFATWLTAHPAQKLLLIVDQWEELVTLCRDAEQRTQFQVLLQQLLTLYPDQLRVILTLRTDFEPQFAESPLAARWQASRFIVPPLTQAELRTVIEGPASVRVLFFEPPPLVDTLIDEVIQTPGALPLLSFTLEQLYLKYLKRQAAAQAVGDPSERSLTYADYAELGGVIGSLRTRADEEYAALPDAAHRATMARVMLRMVAIEGGELARRRVTLRELVYPSAAENARVATVIQRLVAARLLVTDSADADGDGVADAHVEPAHDALVRAWGKLLQWKHAGLDYLPLQRRLTQAAQEWSTAEPAMKTSLLWENDPRLPQVQELLWPTTHHDRNLPKWMQWLRQKLWPNVNLPHDTKWLNRAEATFVQASTLRRATSLKRLVGMTATTLIVLAMLAWFANWQRLAAVDQANRAKVGELTAQSKINLTVNPELSLLLARSALTRALPLTEPQSTLAAADALREALFAARIEKRINHLGTAELRAAAFSSDRKYFAVADIAGKVWLYDIGEGTLYFTFEIGANVWVTDLTFSPTLSTRLGVTGYRYENDPKAGATGGFLQVWDLAQHTEVFTTELSESLLDLDFKPNSAVVIIESLNAAAEYGVQLWDIEARQRIRRQQMALQAKRPTFSPDGALIALGVSAQEIAIWDSQLTKELARWSAVATNEEIWGIAFGPDEQIAVTGSQGSVSRWDLSDITSPKLISRQILHEGLVFDVVFSPNGACLATGGNSDQKAVVSRGVEAESINLLGQEDKILALTFFANNPAAAHSLLPCGTALLATVSNDGMLLWNIGPNREYETMIAHASSIEDVAFSPDQRYFVTGSDDGTAQVWSVEPFQQLAVLTHGQRINDVDVSPDGQTIITASKDGTVKIWDSDTRALKLPPLQVNEGALYAAAFRPPDGQQIATGGQGGRVSLWDSQSGRQISGSEWQLSAFAVNSIAFSRDGTQLIVGYADGIIRIIHLLSGHITLLSTAANNSVYDAVFNLDSTSALTAGNDNTIRRWDLATAQTNYLYELDDIVVGSHQGYVYSLGLAPNGTWVASAGDDGNVFIWDLANRKRMITFSGSKVSVNSVKFSPDGRLVVTGDDNGLIHVYLVNSNELAEFATLRTTRHFTEVECQQYDVQDDCF